MGGYLALLLAERGRAQSVVALAPGGGWAVGDDGYLEMLAFFEEMQGLVRNAAPHADAIMRSENGRRRASEYITTRFEHLPADLLAHQLTGAAGCDAAQPLIDRARRDGWHVDAERIACPLRIVWGTDDRVLPWPRAAERYRSTFPHADWVVLDGVGHSPQLDVPLETAELILGWTDPS
jgi:pimeloyl-ACP methyl ester carboxylesterase